jgi:hypothetical protein
MEGVACDAKIWQALSRDSQYQHIAGWLSPKRPGTAWERGGCVCMTESQMARLKATASSTLAIGSSLLR